MLLLFLCVWIIFNGAVTTEILIFGVVIALLMFLFACRFMDYSIQKEKRLICCSGYLLVYIVDLVVEIIRANVAVCHLVLSQNEVTEPVMISFKTNLKSRFTRVILANSITLTPGTITVSLKEDEFIVHCLDKSLSEGIEDSVFVKMLERIEQKG